MFSFVFVRRHIKIIVCGEVGGVVISRGRFHLPELPDNSLYANDSEYRPLVHVDSDAKRRTAASYFFLNMRCWFMLSNSV